MSGQDQQGSKDAGTDMAWMIAGFFAFVLAIWFGFSEQILRALFWLKYYQLQLVGMFTDSGLALSDWLAVNAAVPKEYGQDTILKMLTEVGHYYKYPVGLILIAFSYYLFTHNSGSSFKKSFSMNTLRAQEKKEWPQITPVCHLDLVKEDVGKGPWAMALTPMEFAIQEGVLIPPKRNPKRPHLEMTASVDIEKAKACFQKQMGPRFKGPTALPIYMKAIAGCCAARIHEERKKPTKLLRQMAASSADPAKIDYDGAESLWYEYINEPITQRVMNNHAFVLTMMATMLEVARSDGVFASADFLWLKTVDRRLWYILNNVGRQTAWPEVAGPFCHWRAERKLGRRINTPMIDDAAKALADYIENVIYTGDKEKWEL